MSSVSLLIPIPQIYFKNLFPWPADSQLYVLQFLPFADLAGRVSKSQELVSGLSPTVEVVGQGQLIRVEDLHATAVYQRVLVPVGGVV